MAHTERKGTSWTWYRGEWLEGNPMIMGPMTQAPWLGSCVFDGARAFAEACVAGVVNTQPEARARLEAFANKSAARIRPNE